MEVLEFFKPVDIDAIQGDTGFEEATWAQALAINTGADLDLAERKIVLIGIERPENDDNAANETRKYLYRLGKPEYAEKVADLGNFKFGYLEKDFETLGFVLSELISNNHLPVLLNGSQEITWAQYLAFCYLKDYVNLVSFDPRLDFNMHENKKMDADNFLQKIFMAEPSYLFGYANIGFQSHFTSQPVIDFLENLYFDLHRLGDVRADISNLEPLLRSSHFASWDISSIRQSDAPGVINPSPNGFYSEEACLLSRYSGLGSNMRSIGFYNYAPEKDKDGQTAHLVAQMIWYFVDGVMNQYPESPMENKEDFTKFITALDNNHYQIVFYKSKRTDRWWMEVPINEKEFSGTRHIMPCSYNDYLAATRDEIPERWLNALKKFT